MYFRWKGLIIGIALVIISSLFIARFYKYAIAGLSVMLFLSILNLGLIIITYQSASLDWIEPHATDIQFSSKPNIYVIQPDGYASRDALKNKYYNHENSDFFGYLTRNGFDFNDDYRSNYTSTLSSNSCMFTASHHYYKNQNHKGDPMHARAVINSDNYALNTLKYNNYRLNLISGTTYLMTNHPKSDYDFNNLESELTYFPFFKKDLDVVTPLKTILEEGTNQPQFTFIEFLYPGHVSHAADNNLGAQAERAAYLERIETSNKKIKEIIDLISKADEDAMIIIAADHGGYVGLDYTGEIQERVIDDPGLKEGMFSALFAYKAPDDFEKYATEIKSSVGLFPNLFNYLSKNEPVENLDHSSYIYISNADKKGLYKYFDSNGNVVSEQILK
jgi:hypothetical protein